MKLNDIVEFLSRPIVPLLTFAVAYLMPSKELTPKKTEVSKMRKSITVALILAAIAGALVTVYFYLARRERELNEYEEILFSDDLGEIPTSDLTDEPIID